MHDTAIALVSGGGEILFAASLERVSRLKQDGRPPAPLLAGLPWELIECVAVSTDERLSLPDSTESALHPQRLRAPRTALPLHGAVFTERLATLPRPKTFVCHQLSHAASAFWPSGFEDALCLTYDGGMWNSPWFGGVFRASRTGGILPLDRFSATNYAKITSLYSIVTAVLGFAPNRHEGKVMALAAFGQPSARCRRILEGLFQDDYQQMESVVDWVDVYSDVAVPTLVVDTAARDDLRQRFGALAQAEIAATLQQMTEDHVISILDRARQHGWTSRRLCLAGGLFANVRLNQRIKDFGFEELFVAPAMTDDGTALGAALDVVSRTPGCACVPPADVFLGHDFSSDEIELALQEYGLTYSREADPAAFIVGELIAGNIVAVFQGQMEFGPRALGNRSILCEATRTAVNTELNGRLRRTEFMPFAPITRAEDLDEYYHGLGGVRHTAEFMTVTCGCTQRMAAEVPAVVHVDRTARPQVVRREVHPLLHDVLTRYREQTGLLALVNTSFNVHEEPIVCSPADAIVGFFEAGLDVLYLEGGYVVRGRENASAAAAVLRRRLAAPSMKELQLTALVDHLYRQAAVRTKELDDKRDWGLSLNRAAEERLELLLEKERVILELAREVGRLKTAAGLPRR